jgi:tetratricopeptide (TPR) repeat protein
VQAYRKGLRLDERNERLLYNMAMAYADGRDYGKSRDLLLRAFEATPNFTGGDDPRACYNIAMVFTRMRDRDTALRYAERSLALDPTFESARVLRERLHAKTTAAPDASDLPPDLPEG